GYDGVVSETSDTGESLVSAIGNENLKFYAEFPWFVNLTYQAFDKNQLGVANLTVDNFTVLEDGVEVSKLESEMNIRKRDALPSGYTYGIKTVLFLDNTPSSSVTLEKMLEAGQVIVDNLDAKGQQKVAIVAYDEEGEAEVVQDFTDVLTDLNLALAEGIQQSYGTTNFYSGVIESLALWEDNHSPANPDLQQGFLVAVTDGKDTTGLSNVSSAIAARGDKQVIVVAVGNDIPESILSDLELLGNGGFYHVTDPLLPADEKKDKKENLCEYMLEAQNRMMAYADGFYWLRYKSPITNGNVNSIHTVVLSVIDNRNVEADSTISGTFNSDAFFSGEPNIYFNTSASDPDGITEKIIMIERGQGAGEVAETIQALTFMQSGYNPSQYEWTSGNNGVVTVLPDSTGSAKATVTVVGPGDTSLTVKDTVNNVTQTLAIKVKVREESFEMMKHIVTSTEPWFADATFQVRKTDPANNQWDWTTDLAREDMTVMENGAKIDMEVSEVHIRKRDNIPSNYTYTLKTVLLIDNSPSARNIDNLPLVKQAAKAFAKRALVNNPEDNTDLGPLLSAQGGFQQEIAVMTYDEAGDNLLACGFTSDLAEIEAAIDDIVPGTGPIDFYRGMLDALDLWDNDQSPYDEENDAFVQGVVIVLGDGWQSNPDFIPRAAVLSEIGDKQVICVGVSNDLVSTSDEADLVAFGNDGFYSVPNPGQAVSERVVWDNGVTVKTVNYTELEKTLMGIQDEVYAYANSFYWLDYKSYLPPVIPCSNSESLVITINNNSNTGTGRNVSGNFASCQFFDGNEGTIYVDSKVTDPDGVDEINLEYWMFDGMLIYSGQHSATAATYKATNIPDYEWVSTNENIFKVAVDPGSYGNSRAIISLPAVKREGSANLSLIDHGNGVFKNNLRINVEEVDLVPIAYYPFNGNADNKVADQYDGQVFGATLTPDRKGTPDSAYSFFSNDYIALDMFYGDGVGNVAENLDEVTVCVWIRSTSAANNLRIVSFGYDYFDLSLQFGKLDWMTSTASGGITTMITEDKYNDGKWHFICATLNSSGEKKIYVDGLPVAATTATGVLPIGNVRYGFVGVFSQATEFNGDHHAGTYFTGSIDDVIIFDRELSADAIKNLSEGLK
ncbi:MAG: LamG-like jellyroll fold domain-containing protein, partial [Desulfosalsimonadaceae bacterium]|nr:LamG-like jellyroll fold domain-containing protein [Desulfosalsimonadaceae bacterium]